MLALLPLLAVKSGSSVTLAANQVIFVAAEQHSAAYRVPTLKPTDSVAVGSDERRFLMRLIFQHNAATRLQEFFYGDGRCTGEFIALAMQQVESFTCTGYVCRRSRRMAVQIFTS